MLWTATQYLTPTPSDDVVQDQYHAGSVEISNGNARSVMLDNLEEDSDYSITLTANSGTIQLDSDVVTATTSTAGTA